MTARLPVPLERLDLPEHLDGHTGANRAQGHAQIAARRDLDALAAWLARVADTPTTCANYRKEAERLLLWSVYALNKPLSSLTHEDLVVYQNFLRDPQPAAFWVMAPGRKWARSHPDWRPFAGPLSSTSVRQALVILNALLSWLVGAGYLAGNPLSLSRQRQRSAAPRLTRYLDSELWQEVKVTIEQLPRNVPRATEHYDRVRWLFSLFYVCGLRISEVAENSMGGFFGRGDKHGVERIWLEIHGKGGKTRLVPVTPELLAELERYRVLRGLSRRPLPGETTPLLLPIGGEPRSLSRSSLHRIVKEMFERTADRLEHQGGHLAARASLLRAASAHWLRHTAGSHMADGQMDLRHVRDNLGHASLTTTSHYLHSEDDLRHADTAQHHQLNW